MIANIIADRKRVGLLLKQILEGTLSPEASLRIWPEYEDDASIVAAKHALEHFITDNDIRQMDKNYEKHQILQLTRFKKRLEKGEPLCEIDIEYLRPRYIGLSAIIKKFLTAMKIT